MKNSKILEWLGVITAIIYALLVALNAKNKKKMPIAIQDKIKTKEGKNVASAKLT